MSGTLKLRVVQAEYGDCLLVDLGAPTDLKHILIDGGPDTIYDRHLRGELLGVRDSGGKVDLAVLSHVDNDHITGLLDLLAEIRTQRANGDPETVGLSAFWFNSFSQTIEVDNEVEARVKALIGMGNAGRTMATAGMAVQGIGEGNQLRLGAGALGLPVNPGFPRDLVSLETAPEAIVLGGAKLRIVGPTQRNLEELRREWLEWLDGHEEAIRSGDPFLAAMADRSVPNLSSIMILVEADGRRILLTGDGRGDHLLQGLDKAGLLAPNGGLHVDVLKLPHHGSDRNVTRKFFQTVTADTYVASANGKDGNPDLATLIWIAEAAKQRGRAVRILVTNETPSTKQFRREYDLVEYGCDLIVMDATAHALVV